MDDPWGSPWAATDPDKDAKLASPAKSDIAPPPRAFLSASSSPRIPAVVEQSPWGGDDAGFGEWATVSETPAHSVWPGGWSGSSPNLAATPRDDLLKASPIALPGNIATPKPANGSVFRQPSPDPWASGFSSRRPSNDAAFAPRLVVEAASPVDAPIDTFEEDALGIEGDAVWDTSNAVGTSETTVVVEPDPITAEPEDEESVEEQTTPVAAPGSDVRLSVESTGQGREYQSSTPSNANTDHEEDRQDSPVTSIDEEPRDLRRGGRKASGKVQELVVKFDGLARAASEEREVISRERSTSPSSVRKGSGSGDAADFGEFEDVDAGEEERPLPQGPPARDPQRVELVVPDAPALLRTALPHDSSSNPSPIAKFGPIHFSVDLDLAAKLFTTTPGAAGETEADQGVPDHVITDSFTAISERKTWYRISRLGSSRRHNAGDDDSYRRVLWPSSTVHDDTTKIVRRWMEEDSIAGRVALGGGISKTQKNMFGWDSSAAPVALDAVFGKKNAHSRASSVQPLQTTGLSLGLADGLAKQSPQHPTHRASGSAGPAVPSFGWSSSSPAETHTTNVIADPPNAVSRPAPQVPPGQGGSFPDDDDDEWGEMISSPVTSQPIATGPAVQMPTARVSAVPAQQSNSVRAASKGAAPNDPWSATDLSVFDSAPAIPKVVDPSAQGPVPASKPETSGPSPSGPTTTDGPPTFSSPIEPQKFSISDTQHEHEKAAQRIIANFPDLSYMLR
ncbi:hypothetical protein C8A01DRAFT_18924 [Parachaetomium inaequale]|uniref:Uncharacterized protein n=1 Tax=Parachaetomium inaequale TaxID=2588326 RepID=A0AAN6P9K9_9PEZI|nr:hypothetical protein C8A01DRAFT_18924 [Parachaetomium inaequale]